MRAPEVFKEVTQVRDKLSAMRNTVETKSLPIEVQDLILKEIASAGNKTQNNWSQLDFENTGRKLQDAGSKFSMGQIRSKRNSSREKLNSKRSNVSLDPYKA